jgi:pyruvate dehydrogenase E2 component (dihydrolipoamide acetyltransferase)
MPPSAGVAETSSARGGGDVLEPTQGELAHARRVAEAKATVPHVYFDAAAEIGAGVRTSTADLVVMTALALRKFPRLNATYRDARFELHARVNIGVAATFGEGLLYPTIHDADEKDPGAIASELTALTQRARDGELTQPEVSGATFSVADLAPLGLSRASLVVNRGQAAILAVGAPTGGATTLSLACDNRIVQAPDAAGFLRAVSEQLARRHP